MRTCCLAAVYLRPYHRLVVPRYQLPLSTQARPDFNYYFKVANLNDDGLTLPGYAIRATCHQADLTPCPQPDMAGQPCSGHGTCVTPDQVCVHSSIHI